MTRSQALRKLQRAVDHIADVMERCDEAPLAELSEALDLIHAAEGEINDA